jgi:hypothetical protein
MDIKALMRIANLESGIRSLGLTIEPPKYKLPPEFNKLPRRKELTAEDLMSIYKQTGSVVCISRHQKSNVQCSGCGATHNEEKCPYCGRLKIDNN